MICYKDMTFCAAKCLTRDCPRNWTEDKAQAARDWWGGDDPPVAFSNYAERCPDYQPEVKS